MFDSPNAECGSSGSKQARRTVSERRKAYTFVDTHSWLGVGLQNLLRVGWRAECSQAQTINAQ